MSYDIRELVDDWTCLDGKADTAAKRFERGVAFVAHAIRMPWLATLALVGCTKSAPPAPAPAAELTVGTSSAPKPVVVLEAGAPDAAATTLAERPATTLTELWTKRLASAYLAHDPLLERIAAQYLSHAMRSAPLEEELATLKSLQAIAPVFEDADFSYLVGAKSPVPEGKIGWDVKLDDDLKRAPLYAALYRKLNPLGRFHIAVHHHEKDDALLKAMLAVTVQDHVCPLPLHKGMSGFDEYSEAIAKIGCPTELRAMDGSYWYDAKAESGEGEPLARCVAAIAKWLEPRPLAREAWFGEYRAVRMRYGCSGLTQDLPKDKKRDVITAAFAAADIETKAQLLSLMLDFKGAVTKADLESLAADRRTRAHTRYVLEQAQRLRDFPAAHATREALNEGTLVDWVRGFFGSVPDEITPLPPMTRAKDGKPAKIAFYRFRALPPKDNAGLGAFEFALGDEVGTKWDTVPGELRKYLEEHIHDGRSVSLFDQDR